MKWPKVKLGEVVSFKGGGTPRKDVQDYWLNEIPWATVKDFKSLYLSSTQDSISHKGLEESASNLIPAGHVIIPTRMALGKAAINNIDLAINQDLRALIPKQPVDSLYLLHSMLGLAEIIEQNGSGATVKGITQAKLAELQIPLPPLAEQKRIAAILDAADALRAKRREALALLDTLLQSTFLEMFGDPVTNPKGWDVQKSGKIFLHPPRIGTIISATDQGILVVRVGEIGSSRIAFERCGRVNIQYKDLLKYKLEQGDTVIARAIGSKNQLGKASFFDGFNEVVVIDSHVMRLRPNPSVCNSIWFYSLLSSVRGKELILKAGGATAVQFNINTKQASSLPIPLPPLELQKKFAAVVESIEAQKERMRGHLAGLDALFSSLQDRAFRGEL
jgi:type I restriction enzyme S subunit